MKNNIMKIIMRVHANLLEKKGKVSVCWLLILIFLAAGVAPLWAAFEEVPVLQAKSILASELFKGKNHQVQDQVKNDGLFNHYSVETDFGTFQADSTTDLKILVNEINAIADMRTVKTDDTAYAGFKQSGANTVDGMKALFKDPEGTFEGAVAGVSSLFNRAKETVGERKTTGAEDSRFEQLVGISKAKGEIASKYGVNVYSRNKVLQTELDRLGQADYLGGLGVGVATSFVPGIGGFVLSTSGTARLLNEAINTTPASELWRQNKNTLVAMGMNPDTVKLFLNNPSFSPLLETVLVKALESMKGVGNRELFIKVALQAGNPNMAKFITRLTVMLAGYHKEIAPLQSVSPMARVARGIRKDGTSLVAVPTDHIIWNKKVAEVLSAVKSESKGGNPELWILGTISKQAASELQKQEWIIHAEAEFKLLPALK